MTKHSNGVVLQGVRISDLNLSFNPHEPFLKATQNFKPSRLHTTVEVIYRYKSKWAARHRGRVQGNCALIHTLAIPGGYNAISPHTCYNQLGDFLQYITSKKFLTLRTHLKPHPDGYLYSVWTNWMGTFFFFYTCSDKCCPTGRTFYLTLSSGC